MSATGWTQEASPFHAGEQAIQARLGVREKMEHFGRRVIRDYLPEQHRDFYNELPFLALGSVDDEGRPWASLVAGPPGFITSPDDRTLRVGTPPLAGSPLAEAHVSGAPIGILGMMPDARRRNRATGRLAAVGEQYFDIAIDQSFGNCPAFIQSREVTADLPTPDSPTRVTQHEGHILDDVGRSMITEADTFFIASAYGNGRDGAHYGADASHRGGKPGFVRVEENTLTFPDFSGNNHFNTLGNIELTGRAGLLFVDFATGELLYLTGDAEILWDDPAIADFEGAQRFVAIHVRQWRRVGGSLPLHFRFIDESPALDGLGSWEAVAKQAVERRRQSTFEAFDIAQIEQESVDIRSFYLRPSRTASPYPYQPGQFLPVRIASRDTGQALDRFYSLSNAGDGELYRISVKRDGVASGLMHDDLAVGDSVLAKAPAGNFVLGEASDRPIVLLSAGVGVTPVLAMAHALVSGAERGEHQRDVFFIHGARDRRHHAFREEVQALAERYSRLHLHFVYSRPASPAEIEEPRYRRGRIDIAMLKRLLPLDDYEYYICGPTGLTTALYEGLRELQIPEVRIHYEAFGPATVAVSEQPMAADADPVTVRFEKSGLEVQWEPTKGSLLELAESEGIDAPFACRNGSCGTCATRKQQGQVRYPSALIARDAGDEVLLCSAIPESGADLVLDL